MIKNFFIFVVFILPAFISCQGECPEVYRRFNREHTFCLPANRSCSIFARGVQEPEISEILEAHNEYRSRVAMGQETLGGGLPTASDMMELTWDKELQDIAQKWAEQCNFKHDCKNCRQSKNFLVGQNLYESGESCERNCKVSEPEWKMVTKEWYDEVSYFNTNFVTSFAKRSDKIAIGHFSQVVWAKTMKIGCGYVAYRDQGWMNYYYVCNYGPAGNTEGAPTYKTGIPCSNCPKNSSCEGKKTYPGLCRI